MRKLKKLMSVILATVMVMALAFNVFADGTSTITVNNATPGTMYEAYKILDVVDDGNGNLSYYTNAKWGSAVEAAATLFTVGDEGRVYINDGVTDAQIINWVKGLNLSEVDADKTTTAGADKTAVFSNVEDGYYYITTLSGTLAAITNLSSSVTVSDKSTAPSWDPIDPDTPPTTPDPDDPNSPDPTDPNYPTNLYGKFIADTDVITSTTEWGKVSVAGMGDTQSFMINAYVPTNNDGFAVYDYTITDTLEDGFTYTANTVAAKIYAAGFEYDLPESAITVAGQVITVNYKISSIANYPTDAHISITYQAVVNTSAQDTNLNTAELSWTQYDSTMGTPDTPNDQSNPPVPYTPGVPSDPTDPNSPVNPGNPPPAPSFTTTYVCGFGLEKVDADDNTIILDGAQFTLSDANGELYFVMTSQGNYRLAESSETNATNVLVAGSIDVFGLDEGDYTLTEIEAPEGYNKLADSVTITVDKDTHAAAAIPVENHQGPLLPSTGGIGTRIFYITGAVIMLGAVVVFVSKKRSKAEK